MELSRSVEYNDGEFIVLEGGETDRAVFVVLEGQVQVVKETEKGQVNVAVLEEGDIFGEVSFLAQKRGRRSASVVARGRVKIGILDQEKLTAEFRRLSPTFQKMLRDVSERFSKTTELATRLAAKGMKDPNLERRGARRTNGVQLLRIQVSYLPDRGRGLETFTGKETYRGILLNLAATGMGLELFTASFSKSSHPSGAKFIFQFTLPDKPMIRVPGQIIWLREMGGKRARLGIQFTETNPYLQKIISEFLRTVSNK
jgi:CRP/FNR family cyclic AMP-dependent transcriptional regulator